jgi:hypothetical protein
MKDKYVVVTTVSTFRHRYAIPMDELQALNPDVPVDPEWALDLVTCEDIEGFSQLHIGEQIVDMAEKSEEEILELFDKDNDYLKDWDRDYKIKHIRDWRAKWK